MDSQFGGFGPTRSRSRSPIGGRRRDEERRGRRRTVPRVPASQRVYVANIPYDCRWQHVKDLFEEEVGGVKYAELFFDERGEPRGCGIVEFHTPENAEKAVKKLHRFPMKDRKLSVAHDIDCERDEYGKIIPGSGNRSRGLDYSRDGPRRRSPTPNPKDDFVFTETYGLNVDFLRSLGIDCQLASAVFAANLPYDADEERLRELFSLAGHVRTVSLSRDKTGKSRGFAVIEYEHPVEAVQAVSMLNDQMYRDRRLNVKIDKKGAPDERPTPAFNGVLPEGLSSIGVGLGTGGMPLQYNTETAVQPVPAQVLPAAQVAAPAQTAPLNLALAQQLLLAQLAAGFSQAQAAVPGLGMHGAAAAFGGLPGVTPQSSVAPAGASTQSLVPQSVPSFGLGARDQDQRQSTSLLNSMAQVGTGLGRNESMPGPSDIRGMSNTSQESMRGYGRFPDGTSDRDIDPRPYTRRAPSEEAQNAAYSTNVSSANPGVAMRKQYVVFRNLAETVTWEDLRSLASRFGEVDGVEVSGKGTGIVRFRNPKVAERAVENLDKTRFHQQLIEAYIY